MEDQYVLGLMLKTPPSTTQTLPLQYPPPLLAKYRIVPAISSSAPILWAGTKAFGITPPVCSNSLIKSAVMRDGNPEDLN
jgi:hypothetical protein